MNLLVLRVIIQEALLMDLKVIYRTLSSAALEKNVPLLYMPSNKMAKKITEILKNIMPQTTLTGVCAFFLAALLNSTHCSIR